MKKLSNNIADYPDADLLFPGNYIKAAEVKTAGRPIALTIVRIEPRHKLQKNGSGSEYKPVMFFKETQKGLVLNKTNAGRLKKVLGSDPRKWIGCKVVPCVEEVEAFGEMKDAIRIDLAETRKANGERAAPEPASQPEQQQEAFDPQTGEVFG